MGDLIIAWLNYKLRNDSEYYSPPPLPHNFNGICVAQESGSVRLVGKGGVTSPNLTAGHLEVYYNGQWGTVCSYGFGLYEAKTICKQLGFSDYVDYGKFDR